MVHSTWTEASGKWNEALFDGSSRGLRGSSLDDFDTNNQRSWSRNSDPAKRENFSIGFRVATVPSPADFNGDGAVDNLDLRAWQTGYGLNGSATLMQGDADGDLDVDGVDFLVWQQHLSSSTPAVSTNAPVPEPATSLLFIVAAGVFAVSAAESVDTRWRVKHARNRPL